MIELSLKKTFFLVRECYCQKRGFIHRQVNLDWVDLLLDGHVAGKVSMLMRVTARAVGFPESNLIRKLRFSHRARRGYSVSLISSRTRESPARHRRMATFWASLRYTPGLGIDKISSIVMGICLLRLSCCQLLGQKCGTESVSRVLIYCLQFSNCGNFPLPNVETPWRDARLRGERYNVFQQLLYCYYFWGLRVYVVFSIAHGEVATATLPSCFLSTPPFVSPSTLYSKRMYGRVKVRENKFYEAQEIAQCQDGIFQDLRDPIREKILYKEICNSKTTLRRDSLCLLDIEIPDYNDKSRQ